VHALGMDERNRAMGPSAWRLVDERHAVVFEFGQGGFDVVHLDADMVNALAALFQELGGCTSSTLLSPIGKNATLTFWSGTSTT
jgi:hypothetical protein